MKRRKGKKGERGKLRGRSRKGKWEKEREGQRKGKGEKMSQRKKYNGKDFVEEYKVERKK